LSRVWPRRFRAVSSKGTPPALRRVGGEEPPEQEPVALETLASTPEPEPDVVRVAPDWSPSESGPLVYTVSPSAGTLEMMSQESQKRRGNADDFSKWAYYIYPDGVSTEGLNCNDFTQAFVREGDTLSHEGVTISLEFSEDELDYVSIEAVTE